MAARQRYREGAVILPVGGLLLFMPPYLRVLDRPDFLFGIPVLQLYIFGLWFVGILLTAFLSRGLIRTMPSGDLPARREDKTAIPEATPD